MANGRLGKASISSQATTEVYKNTSGAEASISIIGQSSDGTMSLRLDGTSAALTNTTTVVSETYSERYLRYGVKNTSLTGAATVYLSRFEARDKSSLSVVNEIADFYVQDSTTTYSASSSIPGGANPSLASSRFYMPFSTWSDVWIDANYAWTQACAVADNRVCSFPNAAGGTRVIIDEDTFGLRVINGDNTGRNSDENVDYSNAGLALDFWNTETPWGLGLAQQGHLSGIAHDIASPNNSQRDNNSGAASWAFVNSDYVNPTGNFANNNVFCENKTALIQKTNSNFARLNLYSVSTWETSLSASDRARNVSQLANSYTRMFSFTSLKNNRLGGQVMYYNYNPTDSLHYLLLFNSTNALRLVTIDATKGRAAMPASTSPVTVSTTAADMTNSAYFVTDITASLSLTQPTAFAFASDVNNTTRCYFIGTQASPLWALVFSRYNNTTAPEVRYSTDLITWKTPSAFYSPSDYLETIGATTIASNSGVVSASRSNIANLGADGILENDLPFSQYERTGLVLSNNDRVIAYNAGTDPISIQVMGYEGT